MAEVWVFASLRRLTNGKGQLVVPGATVREIIDNIEREHPGIKDALVCKGDLMPGIAVIIDGETGNLGLLERVKEDSEVHFLPAIGGGLSWQKSLFQYASGVMRKRGAEGRSPRVYPESAEGPGV